MSEKRKKIEAILKQELFNNAAARKDFKELVYQLYAAYCSSRLMGSHNRLKVIQDAFDTIVETRLFMDHGELDEK